ILENSLVYHHLQIVSHMNDHVYVIKCFTNHLQLNGWPTDDKAIPQELILVSAWLDKGDDNVFMLQSKHIIQLSETKEKRHWARKF
ncbi:hypothetical protein V8B97DRAFT_1866898, partial [Scleroderma yunnanense]